jgi:CDP-diacylglycerol--serine O-phosphatidyltransferase
VTSIPFYSFKDINFRRSVPFWAVLVIVLGLMLVSANPPMVLFLLFVAYAASGYVLWAWNFRKSRSPF